MSAEYPPFSGDEPTCIKCGYEGASTECREHGQCIHGPGIEDTYGWARNERLHRECTRCGHEWDEAIVTTKAVAESGNAVSAGSENRGWFTGPFLPDGVGMRRASVELKWSSVTAGWARGWSGPGGQMSLALLLSGGALRFEFDDGSRVVLRELGDYALWAPGLRHDVRADGDATLLTVRWPAENGEGQ